MAIDEYKDIENGDNKGLEDLEKPFLESAKKLEYSISSTDEDDQEGNKNGGGSIGVVLLSTFVAVCGSFEFGSCVSRV